MVQVLPSIHRRINSPVLRLPQVTCCLASRDTGLETHAPNQLATGAVSLLHQCIKHNESVSSLACLGEELYSSSLGDGICVWELPDLARAGLFDARSRHLRSVRVLLVNEDRIFTAHGDRKIRIWKRRAVPSSPEKTTYRFIATLPTFKSRLWKSLSQNNYVQIRRHHKKLWIEHVDTISALAYGKVFGVLYSASWDKTVKVWNTSNLECLESISAHDDAVNALAVCDRTGILYTGSADGKVKVWKRGHVNVRKHSLLAVLDGIHSKDASVNALALTNGGDFLFTAGSDRKMNVWGRWKSEDHVGKLLHKLEGCHSQAILTLSTCKHEEGQLLLSGSADKTVILWQIDLQTGWITCVSVLEGHPAPVKSICAAVLSRNNLLLGGDCLVYTGSSKTIKAWWVSKRGTSTSDHQLALEV
ncbi:hypothetical protein KP509_13G036200 [Ceratopteris richardii]|uniref:Uncharacterized protein n=1 Tax=Ceratopteris richardii TaxID=49495 RepID=A0A8T2TEY7_CERRI|nr:hypothetical protein KP509_13G036200 [Ceratopteris richardii]